MALVFDTRFLIAHTFPPSMEHRRLISSFLSRIIGEELYIPSIVVVEYIKVAGRRIGIDAAETRIRSWINSGVRLITLDYDTSMEAGELSAKYPFIPMADIIIATLAGKIKARVVTDDKHFRTLGIKTVWYTRR